LIDIGAGVLHREHAPRDAAQDVGTGEGV
jgi:hypothetical protein